MVHYITVCQEKAEKAENEADKTALNDKITKLTNVVASYDQQTASIERSIEKLEQQMATLVEKENQKKAAENGADKNGADKDEF